jgi:hypothetical protein
MTHRTKNPDIDASDDRTKIGTIQGQAPRDAYKIRTTAVAARREWLKKPAPSLPPKTALLKIRADIAQAPERREGARPMNVVPFPRQLRLTVSFSVLEDPCLLIDRSKEILRSMVVISTTSGLRRTGLEPDFRRFAEACRGRFPAAPQALVEARGLGSWRGSTMTPFAIVAVSIAVFLAELFWILR